MFTHEQVHLIQSSFHRLIDRFDETADLFFEYLFELEPGFRQLFRENSRVQGRKLMKMILTVVNGLNHPQHVAAQMQQLGARHIHYGVDSAYFAIMGQALMWTLQAKLGEHFDEPTHAAWDYLFQMMAYYAIEGMQAA